nr:unnamed protein product [Callosobruchus chinensis]
MDFFTVSPNLSETAKTSKLYHINRLHYKLYNIINSLSDLYTIALLMVPLTYICHMIIDLYYIYKMVFLNVSAMSKFHAILHGCRMVTLFLQLFILGYTCEKLCNSVSIYGSFYNYYTAELNIVKMALVDKTR